MAANPWLSDYGGLSGLSSGGAQTSERGSHGGLDTPPLFEEQPPPSPQWPAFFDDSPSDLAGFLEPGQPAEAGEPLGQLLRDAIQPQSSPPAGPAQPVPLLHQHDDVQEFHDEHDENTVSIITFPDDDGQHPAEEGDSQYWQGVNTISEMLSVFPEFIVHLVLIFLAPFSSTYEALRSAVGRARAGVLGAVGRAAQRAAPLPFHDLPADFHQEANNAALRQQAAEERGPKWRRTDDSWKVEAMGKMDTRLLSSLWDLEQASHGARLQPSQAQLLTAATEASMVALDVALDSGSDWELSCVIYRKVMEDAFETLRRIGGYDHSLYSRSFRRPRPPKADEGPEQGCRQARLGGTMSPFMVKLGNAPAVATAKLQGARKPRPDEVHTRFPFVPQVTVIQLPSSGKFVKGAMMIATAEEAARFLEKEETSLPLNELSHVRHQLIVRTDETRASGVVSGGATGCPVADGRLIREIVLETAPGGGRSVSFLSNAPDASGQTSLAKSALPMLVIGEATFEDWSSGRFVRLKVAGGRIFPTSTAGEAIEVAFPSHVAHRQVPHGTSLVQLPKVPILRHRFIDDAIQCYKEVLELQRSPVAPDEHWALLRKQLEQELPAEGGGWNLAKAVPPKERKAAERARAVWAAAWELAIGGFQLHVARRLLPSPTTLHQLIAETTPDQTRPTSPDQPDEAETRPQVPVLALEDFAKHLSIAIATAHRKVPPAPLSLVACLNIRRIEVGREADIEAKLLRDVLPVGSTHPSVRELCIAYTTTSMEGKKQVVCLEQAYRVFHAHVRQL